MGVSTTQDNTKTNSTKSSKRGPPLIPELNGLLWIIWLPHRRKKSMPVLATRRGQPAGNLRKRMNIFPAGFWLAILESRDESSKGDTEAAMSVMWRSPHTFTQRWREKGRTIFNEVRRQ